MEQKTTYSLKEIAEWPEKKTVSLPKVQRGFVWRPSQIENLWDSILRNYPIGAFVMSLNEKGDAYEMLDGQQRATAICLGFHKPTFRDSKVKVFLDLEKPKGDDNRKYIFRVITKSHPWGYQKTDNTKTLSSENIRKAMELYDIENHLEASFEDLFPFDGTLPVPFHFFIDAALENQNQGQLISKIQGLPYWKKVYDKLIQKVKHAEEDKLKNPKSEKAIPELSNKEKIEDRIVEIFNQVKEILHQKDGQKVPVLYLNFQKLQKDINLSKSEDADQTQYKDQEETVESEEDEETEDEIENLFVRLNAGGTPLRGEDLNYSILKAKIDNELQEKIEKACERFMNPSRFITIAYRLFHHMYHHKKEKIEVTRDALSMRVKPKQFQKTIHENLKDFKKFLNGLLSEKKYDNKTLLEYVKHLLVFNKENNIYGLPYLILFKIADVAPEVMFAVLYRVLIKEDRFKLKTDHHKKMIGLITIFMWLGKGEKRRDHAKLLSNIWPAVKDLNQELFWSSSTVERAKINEALTKVPSFKILEKILDYEVNRDTKVRDKFDKDTKYGSFLDKMFDNRDLILYAQRFFLSKEFKEEYFTLEDTNVPFDWDHIFPSKLIHNRRLIPRPIRDWYNKNGNLRAWPYSLNRKDQDSSPKFKLDPLNPKNYLDNYENLKETEESWKNIMVKEKILNFSELKDYLLKNSLCTKEWAENKTTDYPGFLNLWKDIYKLIITRNLTICKSWYNELLIEDLIPSKKASFESVINMRKWDFNHQYDDELKYASKEEKYCVTKKNLFDNPNIQIFFSYSYEDVSMLDSNEIGFGIYVENSDNLIKEIESSAKVKPKYYIEGKKWIWNNFTLISYDEESYIELFGQFREWLKSFSNKEIKGLVNNFNDLLLTKYKIK